MRKGETTSFSEKCYLPFHNGNKSNVELFSLKFYWIYWRVLLDPISWISWSKEFAIKWDRMFGTRGDKENHMIQ